MALGLQEEDVPLGLSVASLLTEAEREQPVSAPRLSEAGSKRKFNATKELDRNTILYYTV